MRESRKRYYETQCVPDTDPPVKETIKQSNLKLPRPIQVLNDFLGGEPVVRVAMKYSVSLNDAEMQLRKAIRKLQDKCKRCGVEKHVMCDRIHVD